MEDAPKRGRTRERRDSSTPSSSAASSRPASPEKHGKSKAKSKAKEEDKAVETDDAVAQASKKRSPSAVRADEASVEKSALRTHTMEGSSLLASLGVSNVTNKEVIDIALKVFKTQVSKEDMDALLDGKAGLRSAIVDRVDEVNVEWTFVKQHAIGLFYAGLVRGLEILDKDPTSPESNDVRTSLRAVFDGSSQKAVQNLGHLLTFVFQLVATDQPLWQACDKCTEVAREKGVKYYYNRFIPSLEPYEKKEPSSEEEEDAKQYASFVKGVARCCNPNCGKTSTQWTDPNQFGALAKLIELQYAEVRKKFSKQEDVLELLVKEDAFGDKQEDLKRRHARLKEHIAQFFERRKQGKTGLDNTFFVAQSESIAKDIVVHIDAELEARHRRALVRVFCPQLKGLSKNDAKELVLDESRSLFPMESTSSLARVWLWKPPDERFYGLRLEVAGFGRIRDEDAAVKLVLNNPPSKHDIRAPFEQLLASKECTYVPALSLCGFSSPKDATLEDIIKSATRYLFVCDDVSDSTCPVLFGCDADGNLARKLMDVLRKYWRSPFVLFWGPSSWAAFYRKVLEDSGAKEQAIFQLSLSRNVEDAKLLHPQAMVQLTDESLKIRALKSWKDKLDKLTAGCSRRKKGADAEQQDGEEDGNGEASKKKKTSKPKGLQTVSFVDFEALIAKKSGVFAIAPEAMEDLQSDKPVDKLDYKDRRWQPLSDAQRTAALATGGYLFGDLLIFGVAKEELEMSMQEALEGNPAKEGLAEEEIEQYREDLKRKALLALLEERTKNFIHSRGPPPDNWLANALQSIRGWRADVNGTVKSLMDSIGLDVPLVLDARALVNNNIRVLHLGQCSSLFGTTFGTAELGSSLAVRWATRVSATAEQDARLDDSVAFADVVTANVKVRAVATCTKCAAPPEEEDLGPMPMDDSVSTVLTGLSDNDDEEGGDFPDDHISSPLSGLSGEDVDGDDDDNNDDGDDEGDGEDEGDDDDDEDEDDDSFVNEDDTTEPDHWEEAATECVCAACNALRHHYNSWLVLQLAVELAVITRHQGNDTRGLLVVPWGGSARAVFSFAKKELEAARWLRELKLEELGVEDIPHPNAVAKCNSLQVLYRYRKNVVDVAIELSHRLHTVERRDRRALAQSLATLYGPYDPEEFTRRKRQRLATARHSLKKRIGAYHARLSVALNVVDEPLFLALRSERVVALEHLRRRALKLNKGNLDVDVVVETPPSPVPPPQGKFVLDVARKGSWKELDRLVYDALHLRTRKEKLAELGLDPSEPQWRQLFARRGSILVRKLLKSLLRPLAPLVAGVRVSKCFFVDVNELASRVVVARSNIAVVLDKAPYACAIEGRVGQLDYLICHDPQRRHALKLDVSDVLFDEVPPVDAKPPPPPPLLLVKAAWKRESVSSSSSLVKVTLLPEYGYVMKMMVVTQEVAASFLVKSMRHVVEQSSNANAQAVVCAAILASFAHTRAHLDRYKAPGVKTTLVDVLKKRMWVRKEGGAYERDLPDAVRELAMAFLSWRRFVPAPYRGNLDAQTDGVQLNVNVVAAAKKKGKDSVSREDRISEQMLQEPDRLVSIGLDAGKSGQRIVPMPRSVSTAILDVARSGLDGAQPELLDEAAVNKLLKGDKRRGVTVSKGDFLSYVRHNEHEAERVAEYAKFDSIVTERHEVLGKQVVPLWRASSSRKMVDAIASQTRVFPLLQFCYNSGAVRQQRRQRARLERNFVGRMISVVSQLPSRVANGYLEENLPLPPRSASSRQAERVHGWKREGKAPNGVSARHDRKRGVRGGKSIDGERVANANIAAANTDTAPPLILISCDVFQGKGQRNNSAFPYLALFRKFKQMIESGPLARRVIVQIINGHRTSRQAAGARSFLLGHPRSDHCSVREGDFKDDWKGPHVDGFFYFYCPVSGQIVRRDDPAGENCSVVGLCELVGAERPQIFTSTTTPIKGLRP